jgi:hypothetical protein
MSQFYQQRLARQHFYGPLVSQGVQSVESPYTEGRVMPLLGQTSPSLEARMMAQHGRLAGLGNDAQEQAGNEPPRSDANKWSELAVGELERDDDVFGSGIFDRPGRMTSNVGDGVFASDYSLPGYVAREVPYAVSRDVTDIASGGEVVMIPGGGFYHIEQDGSIQPSPVLGPTPRPPRLTPATLPTPIPGGPTGDEQPYTVIQPESAAQPPLYAGAPVVSPTVPGAPTGLTVGQTVPVFPPPFIGRQQGLAWRGARTAPSVNARTPSEMTRRMTAARRSLGLDQPSTGPTTGEMAVAGILLGVSVGLLVSAVRGAKKGGVR